MKKAYSQYIFPEKKILFDAYKSTIAEQYDRMRAHLIPKGLTEKEIREEVALVHNAIEISWDAINGKCIHYFFTGNDIYNWLKNCAAPLTDDMTQIILRSKDNSRWKSSPFMFHFPGGGSMAYLCSWGYGGVNIQTGSLTKENTLFILRGKNFSPMYIKPGGLLKNETDSEFIEHVSVVSSALAYVQCFPDMVKVGIPEDLKHQNYYKNQSCKSIGMHESLICRDGPTPHYRVGHFRFLQSERFTKKRGQIIFIHGVFVKGQAATVLSPDQEVIA